MVEGGCYHEYIVKNRRDRKTERKTGGKTGRKTGKKY